MRKDEKVVAKRIKMLNFLYKNELNGHYYQNLL